MRDYWFIFSCTRMKKNIIRKVPPSWIRNWRVNCGTFQRCFRRKDFPAGNDNSVVTIVRNDKRKHIQTRIPKCGGAEITLSVENRHS